jgi:hypothetical protein
MRGKRLDADLRRAVITMCNRGMSHDNVAKFTGVSPRTVSRILWELKKLGDKAVMHKRTRLPEHDSRKADFWIKLANVKDNGLEYMALGGAADGCLAPGQEALSQQHDLLPLGIVELCVSFGRAVTVEAEAGCFVARQGPDSIFAAFSKLCPSLCILEDKGRKARTRPEKVSSLFFNKALEHCGGFERQKRRKWRPEEAGRESGTWMFGRRRWIDPSSEEDLYACRIQYRALLTKFPVGIEIPSYFDVTEVLRELRQSWLSKNPDIPDLKTKKPSERKKRSDKDGKTMASVGREREGGGGGVGGERARSRGGGVTLREGGERDMCGQVTGGVATIVWAGIRP